MDEDNVTFSVKDCTKEGKWKTLTLSRIEFIRRFARMQKYIFGIDICTYSECAEKCCTGRYGPHRE
uniref:hypothetical protein n=1 Tax=Petralouisia muris TaxID=3032872 RepID=UPI0023B84DC2|nr:hypothetical protein [Petralouisia muris]